MLKEKCKYYYFDQRSLEWERIRLGRITGSIVKDFMAKDGTITRDNAILKKATEQVLGKTCEEEIKFNVDIDRGIMLEPIARKKYINKTGNNVKEIGFITPIDNNGNEKIYLGCSPDGLVGDDGILEIKAPKNYNYLQRLVKDEVPKEYIYQIQFNLWISGRDWCDYIMYNEDFENIIGNGLYIKRIEKDENIIKTIQERVVSAIEIIDLYKKNIFNNLKLEF